MGTKTNITIVFVIGTILIGIGALYMFVPTEQLPNGNSLTQYDDKILLSDMELTTGYKILKVKIYNTLDETISYIFNTNFAGWESKNVKTIKNNNILLFECSWKTGAEELNTTVLSDYTITFNFSSTSLGNNFYSVGLSLNQFTVV